jgi:spoIIIJ-associated protein
MSEKRTSLEVIASSIDEALEQGSSELNLPEEAFEVEVLDEGTKRLWGFGTRQARYRLTVSNAWLKRTEAKEESTAEETPTAAPDAPVVSSEDDEVALRITRETVVELLQRMDITAEVQGRWGQADAPDRIRPLLIDIHGDDLSILIGRRGETLSALQYITRLIVGKELKRPVAVLIDIEGYRARRERQLRQLARRVANQALETSRVMTLEPMPAYERRIIHIELRDNPDVETESVGEGNRRKVTIIPR